MKLRRRWHTGMGQQHRWQPSHDGFGLHRRMATVHPRSLRHRRAESDHQRRTGHRRASELLADTTIRYSAYIDRSFEVENEIDGGAAGYMALLEDAFRKYGVDVPLTFNDIGAYGTFSGGSGAVDLCASRSMVIQPEQEPDAATRNACRWVRQLSAGLRLQQRRLVWRADQLCGVPSRVQPEHSAVHPRVSASAIAPSSFGGLTLASRFQGGSFDPYVPARASGHLCRARS